MYIRKTSWVQDYIKVGHDPRSKHNQQKSKIASANGAWGSLSPSAGILKIIFKQQKILGSKEYLDWLKTDLNAAEIITAQKLM